MSTKSLSKSILIPKGRTLGDNPAPREIILMVSDNSSFILWLSRQSGNTGALQTHSLHTLSPRCLLDYDNLLKVDGNTNLYILFSISFMLLWIIQNSYPTGFSFDKLRALRNMTEPSILTKCENQCSSYRGKMVQNHMLASLKWGKTRKNHFIVIHDIRFGMKITIFISRDERGLVITSKKTGPI